MPNKASGRQSFNRWGYVAVWSRAALVLAVAASCSSDKSTRTQLVCQPGATQRCEGPGACVGAQACADDGLAWEACDCGVDGGASAGAGGSGGSAGHSGASGDASEADANGGVGGIFVDAPGGTGGVSDASCVTSVQDASVASLVFVIDKSGSMGCNPPEYGQTTLQCEIMSGQKLDATKPSKWELATSALDSGWSRMRDGIAVGLTLFPTDNICGVKTTPEVALRPLDATQRAALTAFLAAVAPRGSTPIVGATTLSYEYLRQQRSAGSITGEAYAVLITDGSETCSPDLVSTLASQVPLARDLGIRTYVFGLPGSETARSLLSEIAYLGGTARAPDCIHGTATLDEGDCHFDLTSTISFATDLGTALESISSEVACRYAIPSGLDPSWLNVIGTSGTLPIPQDLADCATGDGWQLSSDQRSVVLCGSACAAVRDDPDARVQFVMSCTTAP